MTRELTRDEYLKAVAEPKKRFQTLDLGAVQRIRLSGALPAPSYWFERNDLIEDDGKYVEDRDSATISLFVDGVPSVLFYLSGSRIDTCTFAFQLTPVQLGKAVGAMKRAKLAKLIPAAARYALENLPETRRATLESALRALVGARGRGNGQGRLKRA